MFHLLVSASEWPDNAGSIPTGRIYIKPDDPLGSAVFTNGNLDPVKVARIPALLVTEIGARGTQFVRVAQITEITSDDRYTTLRYIVDQRVPPFSNDDLVKYSRELGFSQGVLTHTHWALCDADLFRVLFLHQRKRTVVPKVFSIDEIHQPQANLVSVMMPFAAKFKPIYATLRKVGAAAGLECKRADDIWKHHAVIQDIVSLITRARVVICDCSGKNSNVFYEIGIAHALGKEVLLITQSKADIPFDLRHLRYVIYSPNKGGLKELSKAVTSRLQTILNQHPVP